jgi:hypothetical protein
MTAEPMFLVAIHKGRGFASCVVELDEPWGRELVCEFCKECVGFDIRHVDGDEMERLMGIADEALPPKPETCGKTVDEVLR